MWIAAHLLISIFADYSSQDKNQGFSVNVSFNLLEN